MRQCSFRLWKFAEEEYRELVFKCECVCMSSRYNCKKEMQMRIIMCDFGKLSVDKGSVNKGFLNAYLQACFDSGSLDVHIDMETMGAGWFKPSLYQTSSFSCYSSLGNTLMCNQDRKSVV